MTRIAGLVVSTMESSARYTCPDVRSFHLTDGEWVLLLVKHLEHNHSAGSACIWN